MGRVLTLTQSWTNYLIFEGHIQPRPIAYAYLGVGWSVSVEAFFYLLFPFMVLLVPGKMNRVWKVAACAVGVFALFTYFNHLCVKRLDPSMHIMARGTLRGWLIYTSPFMRLGEFIIGCLAGEFFRLLAASTPRRWERLFGHVLLWGSIWFLAYFTVYPPNWDTPTLVNHLQFNTGYAPFCAAIIFCLARYPSLLGWFLSLPTLVLLGEASYGMYLTHPLFQSIFFPRALGEVDIKTEAIMWFDNIGMVVCLHFFCLGMYQFAESPLRRILRKWLSPSEPAKKTIRPTLAPVPMTKPLAA